MPFDIARRVRETIEKLFPSDAGIPIPPKPAGDQASDEAFRDALSEAFLDSGEDVLDPSRVRLFGVPFVSLVLVPQEIRKARYSNRLLQQKMLQPDTGLARIYGFAFEGNYYKLAKPMVFVVNGPGRSRLESRPASIGNWGFESKSFQFADDVRVWEMDKEDLTLRIDIVSGFLSDILLDQALADDGLSARQNLIGARQNLVERPELSARQNLVSRVEMAARHRRD